MGSNGWRSSESALFPPMWPVFKSWRRRDMWVEFVVGSLLRVLRFSPTNFSKFQFDQEWGRRRPLCGCATSKLLLLLLLQAIPRPMVSKALLGV